MFIIQSFFFGVVVMGILLMIIGVVASLYDSNNKK